MGTSRDHGVYEFGPFRLDAAERALTRAGEPVPLRRKGFETLLMLVRNSGRLVRKEALLGEIWQDGTVEEGSLAVNISLLRKALGDDPSCPRYIETVKGRGYRFIAAACETGREREALFVARRTTVRLVAEECEEVATAGEPAARAERRRLGLLLLAGCALLAGLSLGYSSGWLGGAGGGRGRAGVAAAARPRTLAVLPFKMAGPGREQNGHLGLGLTDGLIARLGRGGRVEVRPPEAVRKFEGPGHDALAAGRELGVEAVVDADVHVEGGRVRVTIQLFGVTEERLLWGGTFDERLGRTEAVEEAIAERVASALAER